ncbi:MFS transporter [Legionella longbeachae]|uniref:MFS transporter n=1 Tax=Legionella longbeachae TaxID=450 RepID=UPI001244BE58|nr:MFS transporter [Legionella longbeachae]QEY51038.1 MFS transporter [Legionella longbeachae]
MAFLNFLKPAPYLNEIQDKTIVKQQYRYWRIRTFYAMYIGYVLFYFTRKSFTFAMPALQSTLGMTKTELGMIASILSLSYGISKFLSGILGDKSNPRYLMAIGLILTGVANILFGLSSTWWLFAIFWGMNGWFQGWGWPGCTKLLTHWYSQSERGRWWSIWNTSHNVGGALIPLIVAMCAQYFGWRSAMFVPGIICIFGGFFLINRLRDTPQSLGLPAIEQYREDFSGLSNHPQEKTELSVKEILWNYVLSNPYIWILSISYLFIYIVRTAINDWSMLYLTEVKDYSLITAGSCVIWFEVGGFFGSLVAGWLSDKIFQGKRNPINVLFTAGVFGTLLLFTLTKGYTPLLDSLFLFFFGFFIFGPQMMIGMACAELAHKKAAATATGFAGFFAYCLGAVLAGAPLGAIIKNYGWDSFFLTLFICCLIPLFMMLPIWHVKVHPKYRKSEFSGKSEFAS